MIHQLKNEKLIVEVNSLGAEIRSIKNMDGVDYLWSGDPAYWGKCSPTLFPFVGRLKNFEYQYKGKVYKAEPHGFAKISEFSVVEQSETSILFEMHDSEETYRVYPFHFTFRIRYTLLGNSIQVDWRVQNTDDKEPMYFSIGAHPGFVCPFNGEGKEKEGYMISFKGGKEPLHYYFANYDTGLRIDKKHELSLTDGKIRITKEFFDESSYLFLKEKVNEVSLLTPGGRTYVTVNFDMPILTIWSKERANAPFICIEPWCGCPDGEWFEGSLEEREFGNILSPNGIFETSYRITLS